MSRRSDSERGSAAAEFVLVSALLVALALALVHVSLVIHVRHVLQASAWEGARWASYYGNTPADGARLTQDLITEGLSAGYASDVRVQTTSMGGRPGVQISVVAPVPSVGLWSPGGELRVRAALPRETPG